MYKYWDVRHLVQKRQGKNCTDRQRGNYSLQPHMAYSRISNIDCMCNIGTVNACCTASHRYIRSLRFILSDMIDRSFAVLSVLVSISKTLCVFICICICEAKLDGCVKNWLQVKYLSIGFFNSKIITRESCVAVAYTYIYITNSGVIYFSFFLAIANCVIITHL